MARYNEILVGRFNRALQKFLSMKGEPPAPQLSSEIQPNFSFPIGAEFRYLETWNRYGIFGVQLALAANNSGFRLRSPAASNVVAVIEKMLIRVGVADVINIGLPAAANDFPTILAGARRLDSRTLQGSAMIGSEGNGVAGGNNYFNVNLDVANKDYEMILFEDQEITVLPGDALTLITAGVNESLVVNLIWRERQLEESERA